MIIIKTTEYFKIDFDGNPNQVNAIQGYWRADKVVSILLRSDGLLINIDGENDWIIQYTDVASVNGVAPTSNIDLFNKLT